MLEKYRMIDSCIEWVGDIPQDWVVFPAGGVFSEVKEKNTNNEYSNAFSFRYGEIVDKKTTGIDDGSVDEALSAYRVVSPNTIMINGLNLNYDFITQRVAIVKEKGIITSAYLAVQPDESLIVPKFALYLFKAYDAKQVFHGMGSGVRKTLKYGDFKNIKIIAPSMDEQKTIVAYLDGKMQEIEGIIAEAKASIEEYKVWKASIIYEAVTKGVDPNAEMKDSGIQWFGQIPANWNVYKTLYALSMPITDGPHTTPELFDEGIPFVSAEAVSCGKGRINFGHIRGYISQEFYEECCQKYIPQKNDIYMIKSGATTGRVSYVDTDAKFTIWSPLAVFRCNEERMYFKYLFYFLQSDAYQKQVQLGWTYGTQQNIGMRTLETLKVCVPPIDIQKRIAKELDSRCEIIDGLIEEKEALIADLEAYKKSLIFEVVTGKRRVME